MIPGTALGVLAGDAVFTWMAFRLATRTGRNSITAMPLGLDTPSTFGMVFFVLGPAFAAAKVRFPGDETAAAIWAWQIGACAILISGLFKIACAAAAGWVRRAVPRAGLLGSLTAIALVLISFLPLLEIVAHPLVGMLSLAIILVSLVARVELPGRLPGALVALVAGGSIYYLMLWSGSLSHPPGHVAAPAGTAGLMLPRLLIPSWEVWRASLAYLPVVLPFALATVVGGIDCTESAAAAGDEYDTRAVIFVEGAATIIAGLFGGVIQTTPYIGHPAYKAMGGRAAYTLATALFIGCLGFSGLFTQVYEYIPQGAIFPILIFVGLEITAQSFHATPNRHYPAVALACVPAMAYLVAMFTDTVASAGQLTWDEVGPDASPSLQKLSHQMLTLRILSNGFIVTSLLWGAALAAMIDRRLRAAAACFAIAAACSLFGVMHSPLPGGQLLLPWALKNPLPAAAAGQTPYHLAAAYAAVALLLLAWSLIVKPSQDECMDEEVVSSPSALE
ncbi:MAG: permease [Pirellulales bacterium]